MMLNQIASFKSCSGCYLCCMDSLARFRCLQLLSFDTIRSHRPTTPIIKLAFSAGDFFHFLPSQFANCGSLRHGLSHMIEERRRASSCSAKGKSRDQSGDLRGCTGHIMENSYNSQSYEFFYICVPVSITSH